MRSITRRFPVPPPAHLKVYGGKSRKSERAMEIEMGDADPKNLISLGRYIVQGGFLRQLIERIKGLSVQKGGPIRLGPGAGD